MKNLLMFKPVLWRLIVWKFVPFYTGWALVILINRWAKGYSSFSLLESAIVIMIATIIISLIFRHRYDVIISDGNIRGPGTGAFLPVETFSIADVDVSNFHKQSLYEKISFFHTIRSIKGQKIMVTDFIYGKPVTNNVHSFLRQADSSAA